MLFTKKRLFYILIIPSLSIILLSLFYFTEPPKSTVSATNSENIKNKMASAKIKTDSATQALTTPNLNPEAKAIKAITNIRLRNRNPSTQNRPAPQLLIDNDLLTSTSWKIWSHTQVINLADSSSSDKVLSQISNLRVIESQNENKNFLEFNIANPIAVFNVPQNKPGIITGIIKVQTTQKQQLENDLIQLHAHITHSFDSINYYYVTGTEQFFNLELLYENLKSSPYINHIELEILSRAYEKN